MVTTPAFWAIAQDSSETYIAAEDQVVNNSHNTPHCVLHTAWSVLRVGEIDVLAIAQEPAGQELVVDIQRGCAEVVRLDHAGRDLARFEPCTQSVRVFSVSGGDIFP